MKRLSSPYPYSEKAFQPILLQWKGFPAHTPTLKRLSSLYTPTVKRLSSPSTRLCSRKAFQPSKLVSRGCPAYKMEGVCSPQLDCGNSIGKSIKKINRIFIFFQSKNQSRATSKILNFVSQNQSSIGCFGNDLQAILDFLFVFFFFLLFGSFLRLLPEGIHSILFHHVKLIFFRLLPE